MLYSTVDNHPLLDFLFVKRLYLFNGSDFDRSNDSCASSKVTAGTVVQFSWFCSSVLSTLTSLKMESHSLSSYFLKNKFLD